MRISPATPLKKTPLLGPETRLRMFSVAMLVDFEQLVDSRVREMDSALSPKIKRSTRSDGEKAQRIYWAESIGQCQDGLLS